MTRSMTKENEEEGISLQPLAEVPGLEPLNADEDNFGDLNQVGDEYEVTDQHHHQHQYYQQDR